MEEKKEEVAVDPEIKNEEAKPIEEKVEAKTEALQQVNFDVNMKRKNSSVLGHSAYNAIFSMSCNGIVAD